MTTSSASTPVVGPRSPALSRILLAELAVAVAGLLVGGLTSVGQAVLPAAVQSLANSASGWTLFAFLLAGASRLRPLGAAVAGLLAFTAMLIGYDVVSGLRGFPNGSLLHDVFFWAGLVVGPVTGLSAALLRYGSPVWRALAIVPLAAVLIGDGLHGLTAIAATTSPVYWTASIVLGVAFLLWQLVRQRIRPWLAASVVALVALGAGALWLVYQVLAGGF